MQVSIGNIIELYSRGIAGETDQTIEPISQRVSGFDVLRTHLRIGDVTANQMNCDLVTGFQSLFQGFSPCAVAAVARHDGRAVASQQGYRRTAKPAGSTRNKHYSTLERPLPEIKIE